MEPVMKKARKKTTLDKYSRNFCQVINQLRRGQLFPQLGCDVGNIIAEYILNMEDSVPSRVERQMESICKHISHSWGFDLLYAGTGLAWLIMSIVSSVKFLKAAF